MSAGITGAKRQLPPPSASEAVVALLRENGHLSRQLFRRRMKALDLTAAAARTLMYIGANPGIVQGRLAALLEVQPIALTRVIDGLAAEGQVERRFSESDRRLRLLFLTTKGQGLVRRLHDTHETLNRAITSRLSEEDLTHFASALSDVNASLRQML
jgi:MarR family transcriptional regulator for hemolysin